MPYSCSAFGLLPPLWSSAAMKPGPLRAFSNCSVFMPALSLLHQAISPLRIATGRRDGSNSDRCRFRGATLKLTGRTIMTATMHPAGIARRENGVPPPDVPLADIDFGMREFWQLDDDLRDGAFATLRRESPITFFDVPEFGGFAAGAGHWALTRFDDIHHANRHPEIFSSIPTSTSLNEMPAKIAEFAGSMINLDDPRPLRLRKIVNRAFTPKVVARIEDSVRDRARRIVTDMIANHRDAHADFVAQVSGLLPLQVICDMMGIPQDDEAKVFHWKRVLWGGGEGGGPGK